MTRKKIWLVAASGLAVAGVIVAVVINGMRPPHYSMIYSFGWPPDGAAPNSLILDAADNLFGATYSGGKRSFGTIFRLTPPPPQASPKTSDAPPLWSEEVLSDLGGAGEIGYSPTSLMLDRAGVLYGVNTEGGPAPGFGTLFRSQIVGSSLGNPSRLFSFEARSGLDAISELIFDSAGAVYGTTKGAGALSAGTVFKLTPTDNGWTTTTLYRFTGGGARGKDDGAYPIGRLAMDRSGALYGATTSGGKDGMGTLFKLSPTDGDWKLEIIYTFHQPDQGQGMLLYDFSGRDGDGYAPNSNLTLGSWGELYGTTRYGGEGLRNAGKGTIFKVTPILFGWYGWRTTILHRFSGGTDGQEPHGPLVRTKTGTLFGATALGGAKGKGTIYEVQP
jgi:uncharacterized repeat protein (TIGR03803 family)